MDVYGGGRRRRRKKFWETKTFLSLYKRSIGWERLIILLPVMCSDVSYDVFSLTFELISRAQETERSWTDFGFGHASDALRAALGNCFWARAFRFCISDAPRRTRLSSAEKTISAASKNDFWLGRFSFFAPGQYARARASLNEAHRWAPHTDALLSTRPWGCQKQMHRPKKRFSDAG